MFWNIQIREKPTSIFKSDFVLTFVTKMFRPALRPLSEENNSEHKKGQCV